MSAFLEVRALRAGYQGGVVLDSIDLDVAEGSVVAVLGRNGVGKTTLVSALMGLVKPYAGSVRLAGEQIAGAPTDRIARLGVGLVPQGRRVFAPLTVGEHLMIARRRRPGEWDRDRVLALLPRLGERLGHRGDQLSGGEQQMLAIARALLTNPRLLLLDEPSDGLAPTVVAQVGEVVRSLCEHGMSVVLVEQNLRLAFSVAEHVAVVQKGRVAAYCPTAEFRARPDLAHTLLGVG
ncbi:MAG TPA: ABC transporter ATP-binding protein [Mycobacteriales bacterium]|nr:ABC transporter ATP-binding protein [Mycobacteriales bacterium]